MKHYQMRYLENAEEILRLSQFGAEPSLTDEAWLQDRLDKEKRLRELRFRNMALLNDQFFPDLDRLSELTAEEMEDLNAFSDACMNWRTNIDSGLYVAIHEALLKQCRLRRDRDGVIRELYKLGMGLYYRNRLITGIGGEDANRWRFQNEMVFTEGASYLRYFEELDADDETRGYIIRCLANIALTTANRRKRVAITSQTLAILQDPWYRSLAPGLPWDTFVRRSHQQMSSNRAELSSSGLTPEELAAILDSCFEVFKPEEQNDNPSVRWLWPYYEMEYNCGYATLPVTLERLERLILQTPEDQLDEAGIYGNVQLPIFYGKLLRDNPKQLSDLSRVRFLKAAYDKMLSVLLRFPAERFDDYFFYHVDVVMDNYFETEGVERYLDVLKALFGRFGNRLFIRGKKAGVMLQCLCSALLEREPDYFDELPVLRGLTDPGQRQARLMDFATDCGLLYDIGFMRMNLERTRRLRPLFQDEEEISTLHTVAGAEDLRLRASTRDFADIAQWHHAWYAGGGYPAGYDRYSSPSRAMTDVVAVVVRLQDAWQQAMEAGETSGRPEPRALFRQLLSDECGQFSPKVVSLLSDEALADKLAAILCDDDREAYFEARNMILSNG